MQHEIPVEIWALVIADTCKADQRTCLSVSRTWRKIAISLVFSTVQIHFGFGLENPWRDEQHPYRSSHEEITKMSRSWEILDRIGDDPDFARVVKRVVVLAFAKGHTIFERQTLSKTLKSLPHLRSFHWYGTSPHLPSDVATTLAKHCTELQDLRIPRAQVILYPPQTLPRLTTLQSLTLGFLPNIDTQENEAVDIDEIDKETEPIDFNDLIVASTPNLHVLTYAGDGIWQLPIRALSSLTELTITHSLDLGGLDIVFHHATQLQGLRLYWISYPDLFSTFQHNLTALPMLTSLALSSDVEECSEEQGQALAQFIRGRANLRRLDINLYNLDWRSFTWVLPPPSELMTLNVLGLGCGAGFISKDVSETIVQYLSDDLEAVCLNMPMTYDIQIGSGPLAVVIDRLAQSRRLDFFKFAVHDDVEMWPLAEQFATELKSIRLLSLGKSYWDVGRQSAGATVMQWTYHKRNLKLKEDFFHEDVEWLARYN